MANAVYRINEQIRRNLVAIISLTVALSGLGYNTWRNEATEHNRNVRTAGFEIFVEIGELQRIVFFSRYDKNPDLGSPRAGWAHILTIHDLSQVVQDPIPQQADKLKAAWESHWDQLGVSDASADAINVAIDEMRLAMLDTQRNLH